MHDYMRAIKLKICARENNRRGGELKWQNTEQMGKVISGNGRMAVGRAATRRGMIPTSARCFLILSAHFNLWVRAWVWRWKPR